MNAVLDAVIQARPAAELVPWLFLGDDERTVVNKDSSLLACFELDGIDADGADDGEVNAVCATLDRAYQAFANRPVTVWWTVRRRRTDVYPESDFPDEVSALVDETWKERFRQGDNYVNRHYFSVMLSPATGAERIIGRIQHHIEQGDSLPASVIKSVKSAFSNNAQFAYTLSEFERAIEQLEGMLAAFIESLPHIRLRRLSGNVLRGFLRGFVSANPEHEANAHRGMMLDSYLPDSAVDVGPGQDLLTITGDEAKYVAALALKEIPEDGTFPGMLDAILTLPGEVTISQVFRMAPKDQAHKHIRSVFKYNDLLRFSWKAYVGGGMKGGDMSSAKENSARSGAAEEAHEAMGELSVNRAFFGWHNLTVLVYGPSKDEVQQLAHDASASLRYNGMSPIRERIHLLSAFTGTIPGAWRDVARWLFMEVRNLSDLTPFLTVASGSPVNKYLTQQTKRGCAALTVLPTSYRTPFYFNFHVGSLAHTFLVGPSGSGKSVFVNFLISQWRKYHPCRVFIFDKDFSCKIPTLLQGGRHINLTTEAGRDVVLNPLTLLEDKENWEWVAKWVEMLIASRGYRVSADDYKAIYHAIEGVGTMSDKSNWRLLSVYTLLPPHLRAELESWVGDKPLAKYFDNAEDSFALSDFTCTEMGEIFQNEAVAMAFLEYAFFRIMKELAKNRTGTPVPTMIYLEECWFFLDNPHFAAKIHDWLKTLAKLATHLVMSTQSLDDIANSTVFASIRDNMPTRIFLPNDKANSESLHRLYSSQFELNDAQIQHIASAIQKRDYFITQPGLSRMVQVSFDPVMLACLRSDALAQHTFHRLYDPMDSSWRERYIEEMADAI